MPVTITRLLVLIIALLSFPAAAQMPSNAAMTGEIRPALPGSLATTSLPSSTVTNSPVGPGDILRVTVFGHPDLSAEVGINDKGIINLPLIGGLQVEGLNTAAIAALIADSYRQQKFLLQPEVSVEATLMRSQLVSILGEVRHPGRYPIPGKMTVLELLATAGGLTQDADTNVTLLRLSPDKDGNDIRMPIRLGQTGSAQRNTLDITLHTGDVVYVNKKQVFYIHGEVNRPGAYSMEEEMNVMRAISLGGGVTLRGTTRRINIYRKNSNISASLTDTIEPGDVVYIKESLF